MSNVTVKRRARSRRARRRETCSSCGSSSQRGSGEYHRIGSVFVPREDARGVGGSSRRTLEVAADREQTARLGLGGRREDGVGTEAVDRHGLASDSAINHCAEK